MYLSLTGNEFICEGFRDYIGSIIKLYNNVNTAESIFYVRYCGKSSLKIINILYKDSKIYLDRKMKRAVELAGVEY